MRNAKCLFISSVMRHITPIFWFKMHKKYTDFPLILNLLSLVFNLLSNLAYFFCSYMSHFILNQTTGPPQRLQWPTWIRLIKYWTPIRMLYAHFAAWMNCDMPKILWHYQNPQECSIRNAYELSTRTTTTTRRKILTNTNKQIHIDTYIYIYVVFSRAENPPKTLQSWW